MTTDDLMAEAKTLSSFIRNDNPDHGPVILMCRSDSSEIGIIPLLGDRDENLRISKVVKQIMAKSGCDLYAVISGSWLKDPKTMERTSEAEIVLVSTKELSRVSTSILQRDGDKITFGEWRDGMVQPASKSGWLGSLLVQEDDDETEAA